MTARRTPATATNDVPLAQRLATRIEAAIAQLQRDIREAAAPPRESSNDELQIALAVDDLQVTLADLGLLARELQGAGR